MRRGSWRSEYEGFRVEGYFGFHNTILKVFWLEWISLEVPQEVLGGAKRTVSGKLGKVV